ncbi:MAG TPA: hypothetical protein VEP50_12190 [bacterium]|nr:hypothetical protein [bacterium]
MAPRLFGLLSVCLILSGCSLVAFVPEHQETPPPSVALTVEITGSPGTEFDGSLGTATTTRTITGQVPVSYNVDTPIAVVVSLTKREEDGTLTVRILRAGAEVASRTTAAPYGTILLVYKP